MRFASVPPQLPIRDLLDADPDQLTEGAEAITVAIAAQLAQARNPLAAELVLCNVFRFLEAAAPEKADEQDRLDARFNLLVRVIAHAEGMASSDGLSVLRVCESLGPDVTRAAAGAAAARVAAAGVADPPWAAAIGRPTLLRAWHYGDVFGSQASIGAQFSYPGRDHALMILVDYGLGGGIKDCWVADGRAARDLRDVIGRTLGQNVDAFFDDVDAATLADLLGAALAAAPCPVQEDQIEDVSANLYLARSRAEHVARLAAT